MYKIEKVIGYSPDRNTLPQCVAVLISGPRGGKYILDLFTAEFMIRAVVNNNLMVLEPWNYKVSTFLISYSKQKGIYLETDKEISVGELSKIYNAKLITKKSGINMAVTFGYDLEDVNKFIGMYI